MGNLDNFVELEKMTAEGLFSTDLQTGYKSLISRYQNKSFRNGRTMAQVMQDVSNFAQDIAQSLISKIDQCDHKFCFEVIKTQN